MRTPLIAVIDYGMGNLHSVTKAIAAAGGAPVNISSGGGLENVDAVVLPGVGHFGEAVRRLDERGLADPLRAWIRDGRPFLGICLGLQVLFDSSEESPGVKGLGVFPGVVRRFPTSVGGERLIVPAIGWNSVKSVSPEARRLLGENENERYYFVHSYYVVPAEASLVAATTEYGITYCAAIARGRVYATQFHPEKSGDAGLAILRRFLATVGMRVSHDSEPGRKQAVV